MNNEATALLGLIVDVDKYIHLSTTNMSERTINDHTSVLLNQICLVD